MSGDAGRPDILMVTHRVPYPPDKGDRIRSYHILRWASARARVHLACLADEPVTAGAEAELGRLTERLAVVPLGSRSRWVRALASLALGGTATVGAFGSAGLRRVLRTWSREVRFQAVLVSTSGLAHYGEVDGLRGTPTVVDMVDVDSQKWLDYASNGRFPVAWLHRIEGLRLRKLEASLPTKAEAVTLVSPAEAEVYRRACPGARAVAVPNGVDLDYFRPTPAVDDPICAFVGALDYRPNVEGVRWFSEAVWPEVRRARPEARLLLVGRRPSKTVLGLAAIPGVEVLGTVPDVRPHQARAAVVVAPLLQARGVQNKVLEAMAMGKAVVASPGATEGLDVSPGEHLLEAEGSEAWASAILGLFDDPRRRAALGRAGRGFVEVHHRWSSCLEGFAPLLGLGPAPVDVEAGCVGAAAG